MSKSYLRLPCGCMIYGVAPIPEGMFLCKYHNNTLAHQDNFQVHWQLIDRDTAHYKR